MLDVFKGAATTALTWMLTLWCTFGFSIAVASWAVPSASFVLALLLPDGRWLTYESNSTGRFEIYVRPFPNVGGGQWQVSSTGGNQPLWARSGRELFYVAPDGALMTVPVQSHDTTWSAGTATKLFAASYFTGGIARGYDVSSDGQRFVMIKEGGGTDQIASASQIIVVQHWAEELKRLVPSK